MKSASAVDPVCGKTVDVLRARAIGIFGGVTYYFCSADCKSRFADPRRSDRDAPAQGAPPVAPVAVARPAALPPRPTEPRAPEPAVDSAGSDEPRASSGRGWAVASAVLALGMLSAWAYTRARATPEVPAAPATPQVPVAVSPPVPAPAPPSGAAHVPPPAAVEAHAAAMGGGPTPPLKLGLRWFVERGEWGTRLVERLLVIDAAERATVHVVAQVDMRGDVTSRDGSAPVPAKEAFNASTAESGVIYEDAFSSAGVHLDVRVSRRPDALVAETRNAEGGPWKPSLTLPLAGEARLRGAPLAKKRYLEAAQ